MRRGRLQFQVSCIDEKRALQGRADRRVATSRAWHLIFKSQFGVQILESPILEPCDHIPTLLFSS